MEISCQTKIACYSSGVADDISHFFRDTRNKENSSHFHPSLMIKNRFSFCSQILWTNLWISLSRQRNMPKQKEIFHLNSLHSIFFIHIVQVVTKFSLAIDRNAAPLLAIRGSV
jgi:hypothetical protein